MLKNRKFSAALLIIVVAFSAFVAGSQIGRDLFAAAAENMQPILVMIVGKPEVIVSNPPNNLVPVTIRDPSITVANNAANPLSVKVVDDQATQPFGLLRWVPIENGSSFTFWTIANIPYRKRAVIEFVSVQVRLPTGQNVTWSSFLTSMMGGGGEAEWYVPLSLRGTSVTSTGTFDFLTGAQEMRVYADQLTSITIHIERGGSTNGTLESYWSFSGYFVDLDFP